MLVINKKTSTICGIVISLMPNSIYMYGKLSQRYNELLLSLNEKDKVFLKKTYDFSFKAHLGQKRKSGEDYFIHPLAVALTLHDKFQDLELTCAGLLHDTVEDNPLISIQDIYENFGYEVGYIVDSVTKNKQQYYGDDRIFERKIDKFLFGGMKLLKCFLVKIADRDDNLKTLTNLKDHKQVRMAFETQAIFSPLETIIQFSEIQSIAEGEKNFQDFCQKHNIQNYLDLKDYLINSTFTNFSNESFDSVYKNSSNVTWKITDKSILDEFLKIPNIDDKVETVSIESGENDSFCYMFHFKKGEVMQNNIKLEIGDTYSF